MFCLLSVVVCSCSVQPDDIGSHINVGRTLKLLGDRAGAEKSFHTALNLLPPVLPGPYTCHTLSVRLSYPVTAFVIPGQCASHTQSVHLSYPVSAPIIPGQ